MRDAPRKGVGSILLQSHCLCFIILWLLATLSNPLPLFPEFSEMWRRQLLSLEAYLLA